MNKDQIRAALQQLEADSVDLLPDDWQQLHRLHQHIDHPIKFAKMLRGYYGDSDRAERTPRGFLYLHLGILCGFLHQDG